MRVAGEKGEKGRHSTKACYLSEACYLREASYLGEACYLGEASYLNEDWARMYGAQSARVLIEMRRNAVHTAFWLV